MVNCIKLMGLRDAQSGGETAFLGISVRSCLEEKNESRGSLPLKWKGTIHSAGA